MLNVTHLTKTYPGGQQALRGIDLNIERVGMFGLLGPNGAGKTTFMRILAGILMPTAGDIHIFGHDLTTQIGRRAVQALIGYLPQDLPLYPTFNAYEFLDYMGILKGVNNRTARRQQIDELLETVRLRDVAHRPLRTYSGGMKRRVGIAQAMLGDPRLIIVDEPTAGLDPEERVRFRQLLGQVATRCIVILSTHIIEDIGQSCDDLAIIKQGSVLFRGAPRALIAQAEAHSSAQGLNLEQGYIAIINTPKNAARV
ncbi:MAG: ABC transporter ATP-binding protein [Anaerolineae bacterium]|nr:ABC transporter ATP-binding protein [Anaerolineae bacterium]